VLLNKRDRPCPDLAGGAAGGGEVGAARGRAGQWQCRWKAAGSRQETGDRRQAGGGRQSVAFDTGPFKGSEAGPRLHSLATCLSTSVYPGERAARGHVLHALSPGAAYARCPPPVAAGRGRADSTRHRRRQKCFSSCYRRAYHVRTRSRRSRACQALGGADADADADADVFMPSPLARAMLELEHCHGASPHPSQHPDPLCSPPTRQRPPRAKGHV
jgi:hypothetical protein